MTKGKKCVQCARPAFKGRARCWYHLGRHKESARLWRAKNAERIKASHQAWLLKNAERVRRQDRERYARDPSKKRAAAVRWRKKYPDRKIDAHRVFKYGLKKGQYAEMLAAQRGLCACCGKSETARANHGGPLKSLAVDHCHATNKVRELLCARCNSILGLAQDDPKRLARAIAYLRRHGI
jgi:hypothetical protein